MKSFITSGPGLITIVMLNKLEKMPRGDMFEQMYVRT